MSAFTLTAGMRSLLRYWGTAVKAAALRVGTATFRTFLTTVGAFTEPGMTAPTWRELQQVYGLAAANRNAADRLARASTDAFLSPSMIGLTPNARDLEARNAAPAFRARVGYTSTLTGETYQGFLTVDIPFALTTTVGGFRTLINATLTAMFAAATPGNTSIQGTLSSVDTITLVAY